MLSDGDIVISAATGRPVLVSDAQKLSQDIRENLDSEPQANGTGAGLDGIIGLVDDQFALRAELFRRISDSLGALRLVQEGAQRSDRTTAERFSRIARLSVVPVRAGGQSSTDAVAGAGSLSKTNFAYRLDVLSVEGSTPVVVSGTVAT